jgi:DNA-binding response OmpR family regulator
VRRVVVVVPNRVVRALASQTLTAQGFAPIEVETAQEASAVLAAPPPHVAVVDEELVAAIPELERCTWIALGDPSARASLSAMGACCFIPKPLRSADLLRAVHWVFAVYGGP